MKASTLNRGEDRNSIGKRPMEENKGERQGDKTAKTGRGKPGWGSPIKCYYKGSHRTIHDGGGLCSPGRWPVECRHEMTEGREGEMAAFCKSLFLKWILDTERTKKDGVKEVFWSLAGGKTRSSPFETWMVNARSDLDSKLSSMGLDGTRRAEDRESEVNFRRLKAMLEASNDEDFDWLEEISQKGARLGVDEDMPRVEAVFEKKEKWNLDFTDEVFKDVFADNYESAKANEEDIKRQVMEEVEKGTILHMNMEEAKVKFKGRLAVAALGAVPKELGSSVVRIVDSHPGRGLGISGFPAAWRGAQGSGLCAYERHLWHSLCRLLVAEIGCWGGTTMSQVRRAWTWPTASSICRRRVAGFLWGVLLAEDSLLVLLLGPP